MLSPAVLAAILAAVAFVSFGGGYMVERWHLSAQIEKVTGQNEVLKQANGKCADDIANAQTAMKQIVADTQERERQAADAMQKAAPQVEQRKAVITRIKSLPQVSPDQQCEAIKAEQIVYVQTRRGE